MPKREKTEGTEQEGVAERASKSGGEKEPWRYGGMNGETMPNNAANDWIAALRDTAAKSAKNYWKMTAEQGDTRLIIYQISLKPQLKGR